MFVCLFFKSEQHLPGALMVLVVPTPLVQALTPHFQTHYRTPILKLHKHILETLFHVSMYHIFVTIETNQHQSQSYAHNASKMNPKSYGNNAEV